MTGAAAGLAERFSLDPLLVRSAFVVFVAAGGVGFLAYAVLWLVSKEPMLDTRPVAPRIGLRPLLGVSCIVAGVLIALRQAGIWPGDDLVLPVAVACLGLNVMRLRPTRDSRWGKWTARWPENPIEALFKTKPSVWRILFGAALILAGVSAFVGVQVDLLYYLRSALVPVLATLVGIALVSGPWLLKLGEQLTEERRGRIRLEERAEIAAHLHDSVLQTLALIQRTTDPRTVSSLARVQERELRAWLYGRAGSVDAEYLSVALDEVAGRIEQRHQMPVEVVVVGDVRMDDRLRSFLAACAEAVSNAAKHSGAMLVSVYVEIENDTVTAYVRDEGEGFTAADVPEDRKGISESITGRLERLGGSTSIQSTPGEGTEVQLRMSMSR